jgi:hypothetical protein
MTLKLLFAQTGLSPQLSMPPASRCLWLAHLEKSLSACLAALPVFGCLHFREINVALNKITKIRLNHNPKQENT